MGILLHLPGSLCLAVTRLPIPMQGCRSLPMVLEGTEDLVLELDVQGEVLFLQHAHGLLPVE